MESRIIFDVATKPFPWEPIWAALGAFAFGCLMIILKKLKWRNAVSVKVGYLFMLAAVLGASTDCASWYMSRHGGMKSLTSGVQDDAGRRRELSSDAR
jgi:hypothetical protein